MEEIMEKFAEIFCKSLQMLLQEIEENHEIYIILIILKN